MLEVAVIGAGSAGIVAARHLLANGLKCCIFEAASTMGGAWSSSSSSPRPQKMWNGLHTNLSKHTCQFSDFPWPSSTPTFPSQIDVDRYLHSYAEEFIDPGCFHYNCQVTNITPLADLSGQDNEGVSTTSIVDDVTNTEKSDLDATICGGYRVEWTNKESQTQHVKDFGGVVVATGFFSRPNYPEGISSATITSDIISREVLHSQDYECHEKFINETVAVIGSSFSALEIAVDVTQSAKRVINVLPYIPWVVPRYVITKDHNNNNSTIVLPIDLAFYRRTKPAPFHIEKQTMSTTKPEITKLTKDSCRQRNEQLNDVFGSRQKDILGLPEDFDKSPMVAVSDYYLDLVADGTIEVIHGRLQGIDERGLEVSSDKFAGEHASDMPNTIQATSNATVILPNISKVICCTGFLPDLQSFLDKHILDTIEYDPNDMFSPTTTCWETLHPELSNFAFCGMYRGSYMGVVEQQARLASKVLSGKLTLTEEQYKAQLEVSRQIRKQNSRPQFPHFDYIGFMDSLAIALSWSSTDDHDGSSIPKWNTDTGDIVTPAFYQPDCNLSSAQHEELSMEIEKGRNGSHIPFVVMSALIGCWDFHRTIVHFSNNHQEYVHGTIQYSRPNLGYVLYREDGLYKISDQKSLPVFREYEYVCQDDCLEMYFVEGGKREHLFLSLKFQKQNDNGYWVATSDHLCIKDLYKGTFKIKLDGMKATEVVISYRVKGPAKDYEATTTMIPRGPV